MKIILILLIIVLYIYNTIIRLLTLKNLKIKNERTNLVYDEEGYDNFLSYQKDVINFEFWRSSYNYALVVIILALNLPSILYNLIINNITNNIYLSNILLVIFFIVVQTLDIFFDYYEIFKIEDKYGFNKQTKKGFFIDQIKSFILLSILMSLLALILMKAFYNFKEYFIYISLIIFIIIIVLIPILYPLFNKLFNKFTLLEDGSLKDKIYTFLDKVKYPKSKIYIMDASKRTTKMNAYFMGYGKNKRIVLYDTLLDRMTEDEVVAVLAHEVGHGKHKDIIKRYPLSILNILIMLSLFYYMLVNSQFSLVFGFSETNFVFIAYLFMNLFEIVGIFIGILSNYLSRKAEYNADKFSSLNYQKEAMKTALIKLAKLNYSNLNPHPFVVFMNYSHPTILQRLDTIDNLDK